MVAHLMYKNLRVCHFRSFQDTVLQDMSRINLIGGENGTGKSNVLDAAFHLADRSNPGSLLIPFSWRSIPVLAQDNSSAIRQCFYEGNTSTPIHISANTTRGDFDVSYIWGPQTINQQPTTSVSQRDFLANQKSGTSSNGSTGDGFNILGRHNNVEDMNIKVQFNASGFLAQVQARNLEQLNTCMMINSITRRPDYGHAERYSNIVRDGRENILLDFIHLVHPRISGLKLLASGGGPILHVEVGHNNWIPITYLGEAAS